MRTLLHAIVFIWFLAISSAYGVSDLHIASQLSLASAIVLFIVAYLPLGLVVIYLVTALATRKSPSSRALAVAATAFIALTFAALRFPAWLVSARAHNIEIGSLVTQDDSFLPKDVVERFEETFGTPTAQWSRTGGGPWLTVPSDKYVPAMEGFLRQETQRRAEPDGAANRSQPVLPETNQPSAAAGSAR